MTALAGVWNFDGKPDAGRRCLRMLEAQRIYGPDGPSIWDGGFTALGRSLFSLLPEDMHDRGPIEGGGGRFVLTADVRLDNRDELADALGIAAAEARMLPDAAFLLRAWERWEEGSFDRLYGDYAFALWDVAARRLVLARDALGGRPLHYHRGDGFIAFASMPKGLHALPEVPRAPDEDRVAETLALLPETGPRSFFRDICRVEGGHYVVVSPDDLASREHWAPTRASLGEWRGGDAVEALREQLDRAVAVRLRGAGDAVGAQLSAGLDSSAVAATAARLLAPDRKLVAFTSVPRKGYGGPAPENRLGDEGPIAAATAAMYANMEHVLVSSDGRPTLDNWDRASFLLDRPLYNPCNQRWSDAIDAEASRRGISVMLIGSMGNMTLSYSGIELLPELVRRGALLSLLREGRDLVRTGAMRWRGVFGTAMGPWLPQWMWIALQRRRSHMTYRLNAYTAIRPDNARMTELARIAKERSLDFSYRPRKDALENRLWVMRRIDQANFRKASLGGYGVDHRDPTADRRLAEFCLSLPLSAFLSKGETRQLAKSALADRLPAETIDERRKGYQAVDWHEGVAAARDELLREIASLEEIPAAADLLDVQNMRALLENWPEGGWERPEMVEKYRMKLLRGSASGHFLRRASGTNR